MQERCPCQLAAQGHWTFAPAGHDHGVTLAQWLICCSSHGSEAKSSEARNSIIETYECLVLLFRVPRPRSRCAAPTPYNITRARCPPFAHKTTAINFVRLSPASQQALSAALARNSRAKRLACPRCPRHRIRRRRPRRQNKQQQHDRTSNQRRVRNPKPPKHPGRTLSWRPPRTP